MASLIKRQFQGGPVWYIQFYRGGKQKRIKASDNYHGITTSLHAYVWNGTAQGQG